MELSQIVLASASPRRRQLLQSLGLTVEVMPSGYAEADVPGLSPLDLASHHACEKLRAALAAPTTRPSDAPVLAADTVVDVDGRVLGKPQDRAQARAMLGLLSGRDHLVHTAFALGVPGRADHTFERATTRVYFYRLDSDQISEYVATGEPFDKAGGYGIQGRAASLVERIEGDFYTVMGLPLGRVVRALRRLGFALPKTNDALTEGVPAHDVQAFAPSLHIETNADSLR